MSVNESASADDPLARTTGNGGGNGNGRSNGVTAKVIVPAGVEQALTAVHQTLAREAAKVSAAPTRPLPLPPPPMPKARRRSSPPAGRSNPGNDGRVVDDDIDEFEAEFWQEPPRRPRRTAELVIDTSELTAAERRALGRLRARKVRRILRHVSPWSVFKVSVLFYICLWLILMVAGVILWKVGQTAGVVSNVEKFYAKASGERTFEIDGRGVFRAGAGAGVILVFAGTAVTVLLCLLFNVISDLTGGIRMSVIELEAARRDVRSRRKGAPQVRARARGAALPPPPPKKSKRAKAAAALRKSPAGDATGPPPDAPPPPASARSAEETAAPAPLRAPSTSA